MIRLVAALAPAHRPGMADRDRLRVMRPQNAETASSVTDCTRDPALSVRESESRVSAQPRNPANEMRFPASL
jgi:hypothetical protein